MKRKRADASIENPASSQYTRNQRFSNEDLLDSHHLSTNFCSSIIMGSGTRQVEVLLRSLPLEISPCLEDDETCSCATPSAGFRLRHKIRIGNLGEIGGRGAGDISELRKLSSASTTPDEEEKSASDDRNQPIWTIYSRRSRLESIKSATLILKR